MNKINNFSLIIGVSYISLSILAMFFDLPIKLVNMVSLGAVFFSVSEFMVMLNNCNIKRISIIEILRNPKCNDKYDCVTIYLQEMNKKRLDYNAHQSTVLFNCSIIFKCLAFLCLIVYPFSPMLDFLNNSSKFGNFCTIFSIAIMFFSLYIDEIIQIKHENEDMSELMDCYTLMLDESEKINEKLCLTSEKAIDYAQRERDKNIHQNKRKKSNKKRLK